MIKSYILSPEEKVYLDTSFILNALWNFSDLKNREKTQEIFWLLYIKNWNIFISNIVINEIFNVLERIWFREFIDSKIINSLWIQKETWVNFEKEEREYKRIENDIKLWLDSKKIKKWREEVYKNEYKKFVLDEFENIIDSLFSLNIEIISNFSDQKSYYNNFLQNKKLYKRLDSNDLWHFLICKENKIWTIITCDNDFNDIKNEINIDIVKN